MCMGVYVVGNVVKILLDSVCMFGHSTVWMDVVVGEKVEQMFSVCYGWACGQVHGQSLVYVECVCGLWNATEMNGISV